MAKAKKQITTVQGVKHLKPRAAKYTMGVALTPGLGVKVTPVGGKFYVYTGRAPGKSYTSTWTLGSADDLDFEAAREKAKDWRAKLKAGIDPTLNETALSDGAEGAPVTFGQAAEQYLARHAELRSIKDVKNQVRRMTDVWASRPLVSIKRQDVVDLIDGISASSPSVAHNVFSTLRTMFNEWRDKGPLSEDDPSPCDRYKARKQIGVRASRSRRLEDAELIRLWEETEKLAYPYGDYFRVLLLTGARKSEIAEASWSEIVGNVLIVPPERFKSGKEGRTNRIPINSAVRRILEKIPHKEGFIFSSSEGVRPVTKVDEFKAKIANLGTGKQWQLHDFRRTLTRALRKDLKVDKIVRELLLGHSLKNLDKNYEGDEDDFDEEKLAASELWATHVIKLVTPPTPAGIVNFEEAARARQSTNRS